MQQRIYKQDLQRYAAGVRVLSGFLPGIVTACTVLATRHHSRAVRAALAQQGRGGDVAGGGGVRQVVIALRLLTLTIVACVGDLSVALDAIADAASVLPTAAGSVGPVNQQESRTRESDGKQQVRAVAADAAASTSTVPVPSAAPAGLQSLFARINAARADANSATSDFGPATAASTASTSSVPPAPAQATPAQQPVDVDRAASRAALLAAGQALAAHAPSRYDTARDAAWLRNTQGRLLQIAAQMFSPLSAEYAKDMSYAAGPTPKPEPATISIAPKTPTATSASSERVEELDEIFTEGALADINRMNGSDDVALDALAASLTLGTGAASSASSSASGAASAGKAGGQASHLCLATSSSPAVMTTLAACAHALLRYASLALAPVQVALVDSLAISLTHEHDDVALSAAVGLRNLLNANDASTSPPPAPSSPQLASADVALLLQRVSLGSTSNAPIFTTLQRLYAKRVMSLPRYLRRLAGPLEPEDGRAHATRIVVDASSQASPQAPTPAAGTTAAGSSAVGSSAPDDAESSSFDIPSLLRLVIGYTAFLGVAGRLSATLFPTPADCARVLQVLQDALTVGPPASLRLDSLDWEPPTAVAFAATPSNTIPSSAAPLTPLRIRWLRVVRTAPAGGGMSAAGSSPDQLSSLVIDEVSESFLSERLSVDAAGTFAAHGHGAHASFAPYPAPPMLHAAFAAPGTAALLRLLPRLLAFYLGAGGPPALSDPSFGRTFKGLGGDARSAPVLCDVLVQALGMVEAAAAQRARALTGAAYDGANHESDADGEDDAFATGDGAAGLSKPVGQVASATLLLCELLAGCQLASEHAAHSSKGLVAVLDPHCPIIAAAFPPPPPLSGPVLAGLCGVGISRLTQLPLWHLPVVVSPFMRQGAGLLAPFLAEDSLALGGLDSDDVDVDGGSFSGGAGSDSSPAFAQASLIRNAVTNVSLGAGRGVRASSATASSSSSKQGRQGLQGVLAAYCGTNAIVQSTLLRALAALASSTGRGGVAIEPQVLAAAVMRALEKLGAPVEVRCAFPFLRSSLLVLFPVFPGVSRSESVSCRTNSASSIHHNPGFVLCRQCACPR